MLQNYLKIALRHLWRKNLNPPSSSAVWHSWSIVDNRELVEWVLGLE